MSVIRRLLGIFAKPSEPDHQVRLFRLMRRRNVFLWDPPSRAEARELTVAIRRCLGCRDKARCEELFRSEGSEAHRRFCPNTEYLDALAESLTAERES